VVADLTENNGAKNMTGVLPQQLLQAAIQQHQAGHLPQAEALYQQVLQQDPNHPDALHLLGAIARQTGKKEMAADFITKAIAARPMEPVYYNSMGLVFRDQGKLDEATACYGKALSLKPDYSETYYNLGNVLQIQGRLDEALDCYRKTLSFKPDDANTYNNMGNVLLAQGKTNEATLSYKQALAINPNHAETHSNLGYALQAQGEFENAIASYRLALVLRPDSAKVYNRLALALKQHGSCGEAISSFQRAIMIEPGFVEAYVNLAALYIDYGQFEDAQRFLSMALRIEPKNHGVLGMYSTLRKMTVDDSAWLEAVVTLFEDESFPAQKRYPLQFALGKYYDDTKQYDLAFAAYERANNMQRKLDGIFDRAPFTHLVDSMVSAYGKESINLRREGSSPSELPVLIVGMPRTGTSLIEQIIASHPQAFGAGELNYWLNWFKANQEVVLAGNIGDQLSANTAAEYEKLLRNHSAKSLRIVDKMPGNFAILGVIHQIFPHVKIIHARRDPIDTCLSIYFQFLTTHAYGTDLDDLAFYYRKYDSLMRHWRTVLPAENFMEVAYEDLIENQAGWTRQIIEFVGLEWDEICLDFNRTERRVGTSSNWQVRQKIYHSSCKRWRNYEKYVGKLMTLLDIA